MKALLFGLAALPILFFLLDQWKADVDERTRIYGLIISASACREVVNRFYAEVDINVVRPQLGGCDQTTFEEVEKLSVSDSGVITVVAKGFRDPAVNGKSVTLTPLHDASTSKSAANPTHRRSPVADWKCSAPDMPAGLLPGSCR
jgi:hypothetical protein